jgi:anti-anti-sigma factor
MSALRLPEDFLHVGRFVEGTAVIVHAVGDLDIYTAHVLAEHLTAAAATATPPGPVVADLRQVQYFGAEGITVLVNACHQCQRHRIYFHVVAGPIVVKPLELVGMPESLTMCPTLAEALQPPHDAGSN